MTCNKCGSSRIKVRKAKASPTGQRLECVDCASRYRRVSRMRRQGLLPSTAEEITSAFAAAMASLELGGRKRRKRGQRMRQGRGHYKPRQIHLEGRVGQALSSLR